MPTATTDKRQDQLSMNELQLHLSNQAALLRMDMTREYEELRRFQNSELEYWLKAKVNAQGDFRTEVENSRIPPADRVKIPRTPPPRSQKPPKQDHRPSLQRRDSMLGNVPVDRSPVVQAFPSSESLKTDPSLNPEDQQFLTFFLDLEIVKRNWPSIAPHWSQYVEFFKRKLMTKTAFAKAILEDAVRNDTKRYQVDKQRIQKAREALEQLEQGNTMIMTRIITQAVLELAETGLIEFDSNMTANSKGPAFGLNILNNVLMLEKKQMAARSETATIVEKATDPRQRRS